MNTSNDTQNTPSQQAENADTARFEKIIDDSIGEGFRDRLKDLSLKEVKAIWKLVQKRKANLWSRATADAAASRRWHAKLRNRVGSVLGNIPGLEHIKGAQNEAAYKETSDVFGDKYVGLYDTLASLEEDAFQEARRKGLYY
ncbi:MAG: hypothetical protein NTX63_02800 [Candidatus Peregrinibacteria bacterium]|nr:hypothetical protein [Candidatus Peregrinibacteria bacterium]